MLDVLTIAAHDHRFSRSINQRLFNAYPVDGSKLKAATKRFPQAAFALRQSINPAVCHDQPHNQPRNERLEKQGNAPTEVTTLRD
ncbi:MAG: hypothetical protein JF604_11405 [Bradyrhizobium sp.]|nr:hypothetical protein [Bradyrhizobium sp.]